MKKKLKVGIVGCGAIGSGLVVLLKQKYGSRLKIAALCDADEGKAAALKRKIGEGRVASLDQAVALSDLVIEAASAQVSFDVARRCLKKGRDVLVMSVAGILGKEKGLYRIAESKKSHLYFPSGAICGLDGIRALSLCGIKKIILKTSKPPEALKGAPFIVKNSIDLNSLKEDKIIFRGTAKEAVLAFPQNINVVAVLSLAAGGTVEPEVEIAAVPGLSRNIHEIDVESEAGHIRIRCENVPSPDNPKTSYLAILSAAAAVGRILDSIQIGT